MPTNIAADVVAAETQAEQVRLLMDGVRTSLPASLAAAAVLAYVQWPIVEHSVIAVWLGCVVLVSLLRLSSALIYWTRRPAAATSARWLAVFVAGTALAGVIWGIGAWALYPPHDVAHAAFLGILIAGLAAGAVTSLSASWTAVLAFLIPSLPPLALRFLYSDENVLFALGLLALLFLVAAAIGARQVNASILQNVRLRLQSARQVRALKDSEEQARKLSMVASRTDNAVVITDSDGRIDWVNDGFTRITGYTLDEVAGHRPGSVLQGPDTDREVVDRIRKRLREGRGFQEELLNYRKDGRPYWIAIEVQPIRDEHGGVQQFMAIERDITESRLREQQLEKARQKAEEASRTKSTFLAMMSHEVRTPLNGILGSLSLLQDTRLDPEQRRYVETSRRSGEWLLSLINNILDFSKVEAGRIELEPLPFQVRSLVRSVVEMLEPRASAKAIRILGEVDPAVPAAVIGDVSKIRQVVLNLAGNGVKFTVDGEVRIRVCLLEQSDGAIRLRFAVSDTGTGIPPERQDRLFEEFWTQRSDHRHEHEGTGLGLAISRRLVESLGGTIKFESTVGVGSRFWFDLPLAPAPAASTPADDSGAADEAAMPDLPEHRQLRGRVLIAEDNPANQMIVSSFLARLGLNADVVANGLEAVQAVRGNPYDLVLMDVGMPKMDGVAATQAIRALDGPRGRIPIVAVTAHVMRGERESLLQQGMDDYLSKPIDRAALVDCLARWLPAEKEPAAGGRDPDAPAPAPTLATLVDREVLEQLLQDVGPENARAVVDAFVGELDRQAAALESAANTADLAAMAQAAHRLKGSAASFGAVPLSGVLASVEQAARRGDSEAAMAALNGCLGLARDSGAAMAALRDEIFSPASEAVQP